MRTFNTLRHLKPVQLYYYVIRRLLRLPRKFDVDTPTQADLRKDIRFQIPISHSDTGRGKKFRFLNREKQFADSIDWCPPDTQRLWRYHLHYFDYLRSPDRSHDEKLEFMSSWIDKNHIGSEPGWEPFTVSLRIVNWIFFLTNVLHSGPADKCFYGSLYQQALWLEKNLEFHILANHLFENIKALIFAGTFFAGRDSERWLKTGEVLLNRELKEQILADGGHYERTPQYHALMLENYLDLYNLAINNAGILSENTASELKAAVLRGLEFLQNILHPDGLIPLFNDSAIGGSPTYPQLADYAGRLGILESTAEWSQKRIINYQDSGLFGVRSGRDFFLIDCGAVGPSYQPGHTHCDFLSYELSLDGQRIVVDTGVGEYEAGGLRQHVRSTKAHNTVMVDTEEQSEIWGEFRVARRAVKEIASIEQPSANVVRFAGSFNGFPTIKSVGSHHRSAEIVFKSNAHIENITITDTIDGHSSHLLENYIHLHPVVNFKIKEPGSVELSIQDKNIARITVGDGLEIDIQSNSYCPDFGVKHPNKVIVFRRRAKLPATLTYAIARIS